MELVQGESMQVAKSVLQLIAALDGPRLYVEGFVNGREQGFNLTNYKVSVSVARNRNSDAIVVYYGDMGDFSMQGNTLHPNHSSKNADRAFYEKPAEAAHAIAEFFRAHPNRIEVAGCDENFPFSAG